MVVFHVLLLSFVVAHSAARAPTTELHSEEAKMPGGKQVSLMQSGRAVMPGVNERTADSFELFDEYDTVQRTGAAGSLKSSLVAQAAQLSLPDHFSDPSFYLMALLYAVGFSIAAKLLRQWQSWGAETTEEELLKSSCPTAKQFPVGTKGSNESPVTDAAASFDLGVNANFEALAEAVRSGDESRCLRLVKTHRATKNEDACGCTALHIAAQCGSGAIAQLLIEHGADVNACEAWAETPLHFAARKGSTEVCAVLLEHGAETDSVNESGHTPLFAAAQAGKEAVCEMLLTKGAGLGDTADKELPPLLNALLVRRMFIGATPKACDVEGHESADETYLADETNFE